MREGPAKEKEREGLTREESEKGFQRRYIFKPHPQQPIGSSQVHPPTAHFI